MLITPLKDSLGDSIHCLTLTKEFFDANSIDSKKEKLISDFLTYEDLPIQYMDQVHGNRVQSISSVSSPIIETDALVSASDNLILGILSADCMPIAISKKDGSVFAIIHAGWRGLISGVIQTCLSSFINDEIKLTAWIGPSISGGFYEVGPELYDAFMKSDEHSQSNFKRVNPKKWLFDLNGEAKRILKNHNVEVHVSNQCTYTNHDLFYSYRRDQTENRLLTMIWRKV
ncbi:MAG: peptidoglycan editing factor PgeF [SAR86 cluster bacterium]|nr:peptidoglycan editing factor PgeF [SAR86 cluster bacterium]